MSRRLYPMFLDSQLAIAEIEKLKLEYPLETVDGLLCEGELWSLLYDHTSNSIINYPDLYGFRDTGVFEADDIRYQILTNIWLQDPWSDALSSSLALFEVFGVFTGCLTHFKGIPYNDFGFSQCVLMKPESAKRFFDLTQSINFAYLEPAFSQFCTVGHDGYKYSYYPSFEHLRCHLEELAGLFLTASEHTDCILYVHPG